MEAIATGMHVAYADIPVLSWAEGYKNGTKFKAGDSDSLANVMKKEYKLWKKEKGWIETFSWRRTVERLQEVLK